MSLEMMQGAPLMRGCDGGRNPFHEEDATRSMMTHWSWKPPA
jgi:hypothetical protein